MTGQHVVICLDYIVFNDAVALTHTHTDRHRDTHTHTERERHTHTLKSTITAIEFAVQMWSYDRTACRYLSGLYCV